MNMIHSIRSRIAFWYAVLILMAMTGLGLYLSHAVRQAHLVDLGKELAREARLVGEAIKNCVGETAPYPTVDALALRYATLLDARVTIIGLDGIVVGESHENRLTMDNHLYRPEVQEALRTGQGSSVRFSATIGHNMMYVAVPVTAGDTVIAVVRVALSLRDIEANVMRLRM
ncbi:MAG: PAS domain-containing sensor histidine kinase, partial [Chloroflexi bacterium]|nr:PAS domain-containing sensor histidine kinase [Chloroflexota bacterium]